MYICALCKKEVVIDKFLSRKSSCHYCNADLHICLNCKFYSESAHNKCLEPGAEFQRNREKANFCDFFAFRDGDTASSDKAKEEAKRKLDDLFSR